MPKAKEVETASTEIAVTASRDAGAIVTAANGRKFKVARQVTLPTLKHEQGTEVMFVVEEALSVKEKRGRDSQEVDASTGEIKTKTITTVRVLNLEDGRHYQYVVPAIFQSRLIEQYPDGSYVGRAFAIRKGKKENGARGVVPLDIIELEEAE